MPPLVAQHSIDADERGCKKRPVSAFPTPGGLPANGPKENNGRERLGNGVKAKTKAKIASAKLKGNEASGAGVTT